MSDIENVTITELRNYSNTNCKNIEEHKRLVIKVTVLIKSCIRTWGGQLAFFMDLRDSSGNIISAVSDTLPGTIKLFKLLEENKVYTIIGFGLKNAGFGYTSISHPKWIYLYDFTKVELCGDDPNPLEKWPITPLKELVEGKFVNVTGVCNYIGNVIHLKNKKTRTVEIQDATNRVPLQVWEEETLIFNDLPIGSVIFVKDAWCSWGSRELTTTRFIEVISPKSPSIFHSDQLDKAISSEAAPTTSDGLVAITCATRKYISQSTSHFIERRLTDLLNGLAAGVSIDDQGPAFLGRPMYLDGALHLTCADLLTENWVKVSISKMDIPIKLTVVHPENLPKRVRCRVRLPLLRQEDRSGIRRLLTMSNPWAKVRRWLFHSIASRDEHDATSIFVSVPEDLVPVILAKGCRLSFRLGEVYLIFLDTNGRYSSAPPGASNEERAEPTPTMASPVPGQASDTASDDTGRSKAEENTNCLSSAEENLGYLGLEESFNKVLFI